MLLICAPTRRVAAFAVVVASAIFFIALSSALLRGLTLDCGFFGTCAPSRPRMGLEFGFDVFFGSASLLIYLRPVVGSAPRIA
jgi:hypothetical protein